MQATPNQTGGLRFDPIDAGTTVVTATIPSFITTAESAKTVTAGINFPSAFGALGRALQNGTFTGSLGASQHPGVRCL